MEKIIAKRSQIQILSYFFLCLVSFVFLSYAYATAPISVNAIKPFPSIVATSSTTIATYTVTNNSSVTLRGIEDQSSSQGGLPSGMTIGASTTCGSAVALAPGRNCIIQLVLHAPVNPTQLSAYLYERVLPGVYGVKTPIGPISVSSDEYLITPTAGAHGNITPNTPQVVKANSSVDFVATPESNYAVKEWFVDGVLAQTGGTKYTLSAITKDHGVSVSFGTQYAYVGDSGTGSVYQCSIEEATGLFSACKSTPKVDSPNWTPTAIQFVKIGGIRYAYVASGGELSETTVEIYKCDLQSDGSFDKCELVLKGTDRKWSAMDLNFATVGGVVYAYIAYLDLELLDSKGEVYKCSLKPDGSFDACEVLFHNGKPKDWGPQSISFVTINDTQYAYVTDSQPSPKGNIYQCTLNTDGSFNNCSSALPSELIGDWTFLQMTKFATIGGKLYAYVADSSDGFGQGTVYKSALDENGQFNIWSDITPSSIQGLWDPIAINFTTVNGIEYAYIGSDDEMDTPAQMFQCSLNDAGTFNTCTPISESQSWVQPGAIAFNVS